MIERAEWRVRADDPKTPIGWMMGVDRWRGVPVYACIALTSAAIATGYNLIDVILPAGVESVSGEIGLFCTCGFLIAYAAPRTRHVEPPDPAPGEVYGATVKIEFGERAIGEDQGIVAFNEGWLLFEGVRNSFSIKRGDVHDYQRVTDKLFVRLFSGHRIGFVGDTALITELETWLAAPSVKGISRFPPTEQHPAQRLRRSALLQLFSAGALGLSISLAVRAMAFSLRSRWVLAESLVFLVLALLLYGWASITASEHKMPSSRQRK